MATTPQERQRRKDARREQGILRWADSIRRSRAGASIPQDDRMHPRESELFAAGYRRGLEAGLAQGKQDGELAAAEHLLAVVEDEMFSAFGRGWECGTAALLERRRAVDDDPRLRSILDALKSRREQDGDR